MNIIQRITAFGEDGRRQHEIARIMGPVATIVELKQQGIIEVRPLFEPNDQDPQWLFELQTFIAKLNEDIRSDTVEFPSIDFQKVTIMRNFDIAEQVEIAKKLIRSKLKGIVEIYNTTSPELLG